MDIERLRNITERITHPPIDKKMVYVGFGSVLLLIACSGGSSAESQKAVELAKKFYLEQKAQGIDFSRGPCLSNNLMPDWVADIAHNPRQPIDDLPENQCPAFREKRAHHFVELDPNGNLIKVY